MSLDDEDLDDMLLWVGKSSDVIIRAYENLSGLNVIKREGYLVGDPVFDRAEQSTGFEVSYDSDLGAFEFSRLWD